MARTDLLDKAAALREAGKYPESAQFYKRALAEDPHDPRAFMGLGDLFRSLENYAAAERSYRQALERDPALFAAHNNLGNVLRMVGRLVEAERNYREALRLRAASMVTRTNLGLCLTEQGRIEEAREVYREVLSREPALAPARSDYLMCLCYDTGIDPHTVFEEHRRWDESCGRVRRGHRTRRTSAGSGRRLKVGYVSPDFRCHSVAYFVEPLIAGHDRGAFDVYAYAEVPLEDETTVRLRDYPIAWRSTVAADDERVAAMIAQDGIDILIDLAGHTAGNRLGVFCRKPAPVQGTYCGYPNTTGIEAVDFRLTDAVADPPGEDAFYTERLVRLDRCFLCYRPPETVPVAGPSPAGPSGAVTLGSFNALPKINDRVIRLWARVLEAIPGSRLLLKNKALTDRELGPRMLRRFAEAGIGAERIEVMGYSPSTGEHLSLYQRVDIALDTFPYNGTTTTCEALWMGVPVVTLAGDHHAGRVGTSLLGAVGLPELAAATEDGYVETVRGLSADRSRLAALRAGMRERVSRSALCDVQGLVRGVEETYRDVWRAACGRKGGEGQ